MTWPRLFEKRITLSSEQNVLQPIHFICWITTYPIDKVVRSLNNWGLLVACVMFKFVYCSHKMGYLVWYYEAYMCLDFCKGKFGGYLGSGHGK